MANVIFYVPHQDDDVLSFGASILNHVTAGGNSVKTVLVTDGSKSAVRNKLNGSSACSWHGKTHSPSAEDYRGTMVNGVLTTGQPLTEYYFSQSRNVEYAASMKALGVNERYIGEELVPAQYYNADGTLDMRISAPYVDGTLTVTQARSLILKFEAKYPNAAHKAQTWLDPHPDHAALGQALRELYNEGKVSDARFYVKPSFKDEFKANSGIATFGTLALTSEELVKFNDALDVYKLWSPPIGRYAVGEHSVPDSFDLARATPTNMIHRP